MADEERVGILRTVLQIDRSDLANELKLAGADYDTFKKKVGGAMADVEKAMGRPEAAVKRLEASLRGDKLLGAANRLVTAVNNVGGATKLTEAEQARANATLQKAIDKYRALGQEAPADMLKVERATRSAAESSKSLTNIQTFAKQAQGGISTLAGSLGMMATGFTTVGIVSGLVALGKEAIAEAGHLADMSAKTGLSAEMLQRLEFVAGQAGGSLDDFTNASFRLGVRLTSGSQSVNKAVEQLGLNLASLKKESPDQQLMKVFDALARVGNEQERNRLGVELFGKQYANVASAVAQNVSEIGKQASVMSNAQVKAFDDAGDAIDRWLHKLKVAAVTFAGSPLVQFENMGRIHDLQEKLGPLVTREDMRGSSGEILARLEDRLKQLDQRDKARSGVTSAPEPVQRTAVEQLAAIDAHIRALQKDAAAVKEINAALAIGGDVLDKVKERYDLTAEALSRWTSLTKEGTKAANEHERAIQGVMDRLTGQKKKTDAGLLVEGLGLQGFTDPNAALTTSAMKALKGAPKEELQQMADTLQDGVNAWKAAGEEVPPAVTAILGALDKLRVYPKSVLSQTIGGVKALEGLAVNPDGSVQMRSASEDAAFGVSFAQSTRNADKAGIFNALNVSGVAGSMVDEFGNVSESIEKVTKDQYDLAEGIEKASRIGVVSFKEMHSALSELGQALEQFAGTTDSSFGRVMADFAQYVQAVNLGMSGVENLRTGYSQFQMGGASNRIAGGVSMATGAAEVATGFMAATESGSDAARIGKGALYGAKIGSNYAGGAGAIVGLAAGAIGGAIRSTGPSKEEKEARAAYANWSKQVIANFNDVGTAQQKLEAGGEDWRKINIAIRDSYLATGRTAEDAMRDLARLNRATANSAEDVAEALKDINDALTEQQQDHDRATTAAEKYGLTVRDLARGSAYAQDIETKSAKELIENWRVLTDAGYDVTTVNSRMASDVSAFLADVQSTGSAIPSIMKPIIDSMAHQGVLFDENGNKIDEMKVNALNFKDIFTDGLDKIAVKLQGVIDRLIQVGSIMTGIDLSTIDAANANIQANKPPVYHPTMYGMYQDDYGVVYQKQDGNYIPINKKHRGGFIERAHAGRYVGPWGDLASDEVPIIAQTGESVMSRFATQLLGGKTGVDALNSGRLLASSVGSNAGWMLPTLNLRDPMASVYAAASRASSPFPAAALSAPTVSAAVKQLSDGGNTHVTVSIAPGAVMVQGASDPKATAQAVLDAVDNGIRRNTGGFRTRLVRHVGKPALQNGLG